MIRRLLPLLVLSAPLAAVDFTGIWIGQLPGRNGASQDVAMKFTQSGGELSGKVYGDYRSTPITEGKADGGTVTFFVTTEEQAGNQINTTKFRYTGVWKDGVLELTREVESATNAGNGGGVQMRGDGKKTLQLKRLI